ncbi:uncharacterized protein RJT20DRAFT_4306 [Scheffersomyces xylosifermentans]|uniref:uncharacterized protein n=1 Tax=Scheffersomyces xylosifermentans TaxID=1304137 RepID=UPI00315CFB40
MVGSHTLPKGPMGYFNPTAPNRYTKRHSRSSSPRPAAEKDAAIKEDDEENEKGDDDNNDDKSDITERRKSVPLIEIEDETEHNTKLNALLYHTSEETVDMYKQQNNSSDLLGRLYYDDYDSDSLTSPTLSTVVSPLLSPVNTGGSIPPIDFTLHPALNASASLSTSLSSAPRSSSKGRPGLSRLSSFERGVSFDTAQNEHRKSLIMKVKHHQFKFRRNNKTFLTGYNNDLESLRAIEWLFEEMVVHGDTIVVLQVLNDKQYDSIDKEKANKALAKIELLNRRLKKVSMVFEVVIGKPQKSLKKAIDEYSPAMMIIGTRHYDVRETSHRSFLSKSSMSKHFLECALVPVILVKPTYHCVENLEHPIQDEKYFQNWIASVEGSTNPKDKSKRKSKIALLSPTISRSSSYTSIASAVPERGPSSSIDNHKFTRQEAENERGRKNDTDNTLSPSTSNSRSRSRSTSKSRGFAKFFGH